MKEKRQLDRMARTRSIFRDIMVQLNSANTFSGIVLMAIGCITLIEFFLAELCFSANTPANQFECVGNIAAEVDFEFVAALADAIEVCCALVACSWTRYAM